MSFQKRPLRAWFRKTLPQGWLPYIRWVLRIPEPTGLGLWDRRRLRRIPRFSPTKTLLFGRSIRVVDSASFLFMHREIFERRIYDFRSQSSSPYVIDAGANIGLGTIFIKQRFPEARVDAFEPDSQVFEALACNVQAFGLADVQLHRKGVWDAVKTVSFQSDHADGGKVVDGDAGGSTSVIETIRLRDLLERCPEVDFLKVDTEGAETRVLLDCRDLLWKVKNLFVEYHSYADRSQSLDELLSCMRQADMRYHMHQTGVMSPFPFLSHVVDDGMDMQLNIFAYRH